jgi:hypothetical protein
MSRLIYPATTEPHRKSVISFVFLKPSNEFAHFDPSRCLCALDQRQLMQGFASGAIKD